MQDALAASRRGPLENSRKGGARFPAESGAKLPDGDGRPRLVIADDDPGVLEQVAAILAPYYVVVARVGDGRALVEQTRKAAPVLVVSDISMPMMSGIEAARAITETCPGVKVVILSVHDDPTYVEAAFEAGASGYVLKFTATKELIPAIEAVLAGRFYRPAAWP